jgi:hypothetical protein
MSDARTTVGRMPGLWPLLAAVGVLVVYNAPLLLMRGIALGSDGILLFYPAEHALAAALSRGELPFWSANVQAGFPLLADGQPGALYPLNLLAFGLLPTPVAHNALLVFHQFLGLWLTFLWGRTLGIGRSGSAWMALVFALTTPLRGDNVPMAEAFAWVPLLFLLAERCALGASGTMFGSTALVGALQWLAGFPQIALYSVLMTFTYLCGRVCIDALPWRQRAGRLLAWVGAALLALGLAAPQLLPTYELSRLSVRAGGITGSMAGEGSLFPLAVVSAIVPSWQGFFIKAGLGSGIYFGMLPCLLALTSIVVLARRGCTQRPQWFFPLLLMTGAAALLALGRFDPLFPIIRRVPGIGYFRIPSRFLMFAQLGLITFFGLAWDKLSSSEIPAAMTKALQRLWSITMAVLLLNVAVGYPVVHWLRPRLTTFAEQLTQRFILSDAYHVQPPSYYHEKIIRLYAMLTEAVSPSNVQVLVPIAIVVAAWWVWRWSAAEPRRDARRRAVWACLLLTDVVIFAGGMRRTEELSMVTRMPPSAQFLQQEVGGRPCRIFWLADDQSVAFQEDDLALLPANYNLLAGLASTGVYSPLGLSTYYRLMQRLGTVNLAFGLRPVTAADVTRDRRLLDFLNVCFVLSRRPLDGFTAVARFDGVTIYRNDAALPRAFAVGEVEVVASPDAALDWIEHHPEHLRDTAVLEEALPVSLDPAAARAAHVAVEDYLPRRVTVDVEAAKPVLLVLTDIYYPGWQAWVDGAGTPIHRTHGVFRAVLVPAGRHRVRFDYRPAMFWRGVVVAGLGVGLLIACMGLRVGKSTGRLRNPRQLW